MHRAFSLVLRKAAVMSSALRQQRARQLLDARFERLRADVPLLARPARGWVRSVREALGLSQNDLAQRLGVNQTTVRRLERSELDRAAQLSTLQRAAEALDCDLVYALVPRGSLQGIVEKRLAAQLAEHVAAVHQSMLLEAQLPDQHDQEHHRLMVEQAAEQW